MLISFIRNGSCSSLSWGRKNLLASAAEAVSYTHLDVYKRQFLLSLYPAGKGFGCMSGQFETFVVVRLSRACIYA